MCKKGLRHVTAVILAAVMLLSVAAVQAQEQPLLQFVAVSDLHLDDLLFQTSDKNIDQYRRTLQQARKKGITTMVCGGDISSYGNTDYWYKARDIAEEEGMTDIIWALGNHAYGTTGLVSNVKENFLTFAGRDSIWYATEINGYQFVVLAVDHGNITEFGEFSDEQLEWFSAALKDAAEKSHGKPVFVVSHFALFSGDTRALLEPELSKYDNVFFLWGHEHGFGGDDLTLSDIITDEPGYTAAKMGMMHYYSTDTSGGLLVRVYRDRVELQMMRVGGAALSPDQRNITNCYTVTLKDKTDAVVSTQKAEHGSIFATPQGDENTVWLGEEIITESTLWQAVERPAWSTADGKTTVCISLPELEKSICLAVAVYDENGRQLGCTMQTVEGGARKTISVSLPVTGSNVQVFQLAEDMKEPIYQRMSANP